MIRVNSGESYLGKDIRKWAVEQCYTDDADEIRRKYFTKDSHIEDDSYYFIMSISTVESYRYTGDLRLFGLHLKRDKKKSPVNYVTLGRKKHILLSLVPRIRVDSERRWLDQFDM